VKKYIMAIDQGTTSTRAIIFDQEGDPKWSNQKDIEQYYPEPSWVEQDANEIWLKTLQVVSSVLIESDLKPADIDSIGITNQRETTVIWDKNTGKPIYNAIVWQSKQTSELADQLVEDGHSETIKDKTGLVVDSYFSATKIQWILDKVEGAHEKAENGDLLFGTIDSWLLWKLTEGQVHATDYSNASRTMLYNIYDLEWDKDLIELFNIPTSMLPEVLPSSGKFGETHEDIFFGANVPITGIAGDQHSALFGQAAFEPGTVKNSYGTGAFVLMNTGEEAVASDHGLVTTIAFGVNGKIHYALEGSIFIAGSAIQWLRDGMEMFKDSAESEKFAEQVESTEGVYVVPAFTGLGAPHWDQNATGAVFGITRGTTNNHFIRATLESLAYQTRDVVKTMEEDSSIEMGIMRVDGGASMNDFLMQFQSDILDLEVERSEVLETTALGAAYLAGLETGFFKDLEDIQDKWDKDGTFKPDMDKEKRNKLLTGWDEAVKSTRTFKPGKNK